MGFWRAICGAKEQVLPSDHSCCMALCESHPRFSTMYEILDEHNHFHAVFPSDVASKSPNPEWNASRKHGHDRHPAPPPNHSTATTADLFGRRRRVASARRNSSALAVPCLSLPHELREESEEDDEEPCDELMHHPGQHPSNSNQQQHIFIARNKSTRELVALRVVPRQLFASNPALRQQIRQEIKILALCRQHSDNILQLYEVFEDSRQLQIAFELVTGGNVLQKRLEAANCCIADPRNGFNGIHASCRDSNCCLCFSEVEISRICQSVVSALVYLHSLQIVHGNIRPEHFLYSNREPEPRVLLGDFGRANHFQQFSFVKRSNCFEDAWNQQKRTPHQHQQEFYWQRMHDIKFLPPWVVRIKPKTNPSIENWAFAQQIDSWSLGVTLYALLCARFPFEGQALVEIEWNIIHTENESLWFPQHVSRAAKDLVLRLLEKDPRRAMTMQEVAEHPFVSSDVASACVFDTQVIQRHVSFAREYFHAAAGAPAAAPVSEVTRIVSVPPRDQRPEVHCHRIEKNNNENDDNGISKTINERLEKKTRSKVVPGKTRLNNNQEEEDEAINNQMDEMESMMQSLNQDDITNQEYNDKSPARRAKHQPEEPEQPEERTSIVSLDGMQVADSSALPITAETYMRQADAALENSIEEDYFAVQKPGSFQTEDSLGSDRWPRSKSREMPMLQSESMASSSDTESYHINNNQQQQQKPNNQRRRRRSQQSSGSITAFDELGYTESQQKGLWQVLCRQRRFLTLKSRGLSNGSFIVKENKSG